MMLVRTDFLSLLSLVAVEAIPLSPSFHHSLMPRDALEWHACGLSSTDELNNTVSILCSSLQVPLDYTDHNSTRTINLPLLKISAFDESTRKDSILVNFGGPGSNGTANFVDLGARLHRIAGGDHDLVLWNPRGTNGDLLFSCYANDTARAIANQLNPIIYGDASNVALGQQWANSEVLINSCSEMQSENASLIGTVFSARDAMQIAAALNSEQINYWGFSYGSAIGSTIAAMFPDRVGKMIIDGVVNPRSYYHDLPLTSRESSDQVLKGFAIGCAQAPERCAVAQNRTSHEVYNYILRMMDDIKLSPAVLKSPPSAGGDSTLSYTAFKGIVYNALYHPEEWQSSAEILHAIAIRNGTLFVQSFGSPTPGGDAEAVTGIRCGDTFARTSTVEDAWSDLLPYQTSSFADIDDPTSLTCARWPFAAKERYDGNFEVKTKNPLLIIGNTWDPATPLSSAKNASLGFDGSVLLEQHGYGHTSSVQASLCTARHVRNFFESGILPRVGTICAIDEPPFPADGGVSSWAYVLKQLDGGHNNGTALV